MDPVQLFGSGYEIPTEESRELDSDLDSYLAWGRKNLSPIEYAAFAAKMRRGAQELKAGVSRINRLNQFTFEIASDIASARTKLHAAAEEFTKKSIPFAQNKANVLAKRQEIDAEIDGFDKLFKGLELDKQPEQKASFSDEIEINDLLRKFSKGKTLTKKFFSALEDQCIDDTCANPIRDWIISAAVHVSMTEVLAQCMPAKLPVYIATGCAHAVAEGARAIKPCVEKLSQNKEVQEVWDKQFLLSGEGTSFAGTMAMSKMLLVGVQVPSDALYAVHDTVSSYTRRMCDKIGLTEENVSRVTKRTLEIIAELKKNDKDLWMRHPE